MAPSTWYTQSKWGATACCSQPCRHRPRGCQQGPLPCRAHRPRKGIRKRDMWRKFESQFHPLHLLCDFGRVKRLLRSLVSGINIFSVFGGLNKVTYQAPSLRLISLTTLCVLGVIESFTKFLWMRETVMASHLTRNENRGHLNYLLLHNDRKSLYGVLAYTFYAWKQLCFLKQKI